MNNKQIPGVYFIQLGKINNLTSCLTLESKYNLPEYSSHYVYEIGFTNNIFTTLMDYDKNHMYNQYKLLFFNYVPLNEFINTKLHLLSFEIINNNISNNTNTNMLLVLKKSDTKLIKDIFNTITFKKNDN